VRVVEQDAVTAHSGGKTADRGRYLVAGLIVLDAPLAQLEHLEAVTPQPLIRRARDQPYHLIVVAGGDSIG
jgi:hypothetical protein